MSRNKLSRHYKKLRKRLKPSIVYFAEKELSKQKSISINALVFASYIETRATYESVMYYYYGNETKTNTQPFDWKTSNRFTIRQINNLYCGNISRVQYTGLFPKSIIKQQDARVTLYVYISSLDLLHAQKHIKKRILQNMVNRLSKMATGVFNWSLENQEQDVLKQKFHEIQELANSQFQILNLLPFRNIRFSSKIFSKQDDERLARGLKKKFGEDCVLIFGNWSAPTTKYHDPIRNKGLLTMLKKNGFTIYLIDEFKTSSVCPDCQGALKKFKRIPSLRPFKRKTMPTVICNGLLKCSNHPSKNFGIEI